MTEIINTFGHLKMIEEKHQVKGKLLQNCSEMRVVVDVLTTAIHVRES